MTNYILGILGIVISVFLFLIGYRQTVGAKKERISAANAQLERILLRLIVLESYIPSQKDIENLISGKAMDLRVGVGDILSAEQLLQIVFTRVAESDLIPARERESLILNLKPLFEKLRIHEDSFIEISAKPSEIYLVLFGFVSSFVGTFVAAVPYIRSLVGASRLPDHLELIRRFVVISSASLVTILCVYIFLRLRASQTEDASLQRERASGEEFEIYVAKLLSSLRIASPVRAREIDYIVETHGKRIGLEVKGSLGSSWRHPMLRDRMEKALKSLALDEVWIVTKDASKALHPFESSSKIRVVPISSLQRSLEPDNRKD